MARDLWRRLDAIVRVSAALLGTLAPSLLATAALAAHLPIAADLRFAIGFFAFIPLWVTAMTVAFLARSGWRTWALCLGATIVLAFVVPEAAFWPSIP